MFDFSVIIPTRNRDDLLKRAVQSVLNQQSVCLQIIVVDDGSGTDATIDHLGEYLKKFGIIYLKTGGNKGGGYSRNLGLDYASSDLVAFLDDDDHWEPDKLKKQAQLISNTDIGLCYTGVSIYRSENSSRYSFRKPFFTDHFKSIMRQNFIGTTSSVVARKVALQQIGGFDSSLPALQDYDLYIRILKKWQVAWSSEPLTLYNDQHSSGKVSASRQRYLNAVAYLLKKYEDENHYSLLMRSLKNIELLKICRSRQFLLETIRSIFSKSLK